MNGMDILGRGRSVAGRARSVGWAVLLLATIGAHAEEAQPPVAVAAHLVDDGDAAKLTFDLSGPVEARARPILDPDRIVVDFPQVNFQIDPSVGRVVSPRSGALVKAFRFGLFGPGKSRVVIELARAACPSESRRSRSRKGPRPRA